MSPDEAAVGRMLDSLERALWLLQPQRMTFTCHEDDSITVDRWLDVVDISSSLFDHCTTSTLRRDGDVVIISVANGTATYRIVDELGDPRRLRCILERLT